MYVTLNIADEIHIEDIDLYLMFSNMLDNAILHIGDPPKIQISIQAESSMLMFHVINSANICTDNSIYSSEHGYGLVTIHQIAEKYHGFADFEKIENRFIATVMIPIL